VPVVSAHSSSLTAVTVRQHLMPRAVPDHNGEKISKIGARLTKSLQKRFGLSICGMSVISEVSNLRR